MMGLVRFRWIAIIFLMIGVVPLWKWGFLQKGNLPYFIGVLALLAVFNALSQGLISSEKPEAQSKVYVHLMVDLLAAAGLLFVSGSAHNPFISILCVHAFLGGMLLRGKLSWVFVLSILSLLGLLQLESFWDEKMTLGADSHSLFMNFLSQWVAIVGSWFVSHFFSKRLQDNENRIRLLQTRQHKADRLKALGALTAGFSHQLATPMNSLKLRMERGSRKLSSGDTQGAKEEFSKAESSLEDCISIFHDMASIFSRSDQTDLQLVEAGAFVSGVLQAWHKEHPEVMVEKEFTEDELPCRIQPLAFSQVIFDLLDNAQEASLSEKALRVRLFRKNSGLYFEVVDQGPGLSSEILSRLGEPFVTSKAEGNGLGIYSAHLMAQAAGGEFKIFNNSSGKGATAQICLPLEGT